MLRAVCPRLCVILSLILMTVTAPAMENSETSPWPLLKRLLLIPGVSGYEGPVADYVASRLQGRADIQRDVAHLAMGGDFPWMKEKGEMVSCCTDGLRPVIFKLERS